MADLDDMVPRIHDAHPQPPAIQRLRSDKSTKSNQSYSSAYEAGDERSSSETERMEPNIATHRRVKPEYDGEDTRLTSKKELAGWYAYGWAAEVFVICGMGSFIPITLEQLARDNGVLLSDHTTPCGSSSATTPAPPAHLFSRAAADTNQCIIYFLGMEINTASFAMFSFSLSVLFQFLVVISISCAADHGHYRKKLLLIFAWTGATATMLFLFITSKVYLLGAVLAIIANTCLGASFVLLNSFLPLLVRHHPDVQEEIEHIYESGEPSDGSDLEDDSALATSTSNLLNPHPVAIPRTSTALRLSTIISSTGIGISYSAALVLQLVSITLLLTINGSHTLQFILFLIGLWWALFTIPSALWLRPRPGPPLPSNLTSSWTTYISHSWVSLWKTLKLTPHLPDVVLFLIAWFLLSDAIATVSGVSILFAKTTLHMPAASLALISVLVTVAGILGAFTWPKISGMLRLTPLHTILVCIGLFTLIPIYGLLDYIPGVYTLSTPIEMYFLGTLYGFILGGLSSYCRSLYGELIPPGYEAAFYALYAITDKGSSIFGPAIVGVIVDRTGGIRPAFWFLAVLIAAPGGIICWVNVERGKRDAAEMGQVLDERDKLKNSDVPDGEERDGLLADAGRVTQNGDHNGEATGHE